MSLALDYDWPALREAWDRDGVVKLPAALNAAQLAETLAAYEWSLANPGPGASRDRHTPEVTFYNDLFNPNALTGYREMLQRSPIPSYVAELWRTPDVWFFYEQVFLKEGGEVRRTPWHQDSSYLAIDGQDLAVVWISFDRLSQADSLEFVKGSHHGILYNGSAFKPGDDTAPLHRGSSLPRLPDIEGDRSGWDIVSWPVEPGDIIVFHPKVLHGGGATHGGMRRRTLTLRFFGDRSVYDPRDGGAGPPIKGFHQRMSAGAPFRDDSFLKLR
ncbi:phytanoyl-CoA dioxygenase family protein [Phenylobacterium soli]|uniref:Phytanoyl-CoA dioxygenase n=1 Tax=Phenylobacterium soli TaxID=2170551 RepID=A0A328API2_9CAUL|nr:phytanoyl-CoA dioxygenase family protein [Phenylobacterium soli]RAK55746.1 phytanoyl-CoA dioxygenase [Phenylobacterium soli]